MFSGSWVSIMKNSECACLLFLFFVLDAGALTWYPKSLQPMFGEQIDLVGVDNVSLSSNQTEPTTILIGKSFLNISKLLI